MGIGFGIGIGIRSGIEIGIGIEAKGSKGKQRDDSLTTSCPFGGQQLITV